MSEVIEYAYTFRMVMPGKTSDELKNLREELVEKSQDTSVPLIASTIEDYMTISLNEDTEFPDERLPYARMIAKSSLKDCGVGARDSVFIEAYATPMNGTSLVHIHAQIIMGGEADSIINLTDEMIHDELERRG